MALATVIGTNTDYGASMSRPRSDLWVAICMAAGLPAESSIDAVHEKYGASVGRGTIQRIAEGGLPRMESLVKMSEAIGVPVEKFLATPENEGRLTKAHPLSHRPHDHPPLLTWGDIVSKEEDLPERFRCEIPDDALWSTTEGGTLKGTPVVFLRTDSPPLPGIGVLVEDGHGQRYIRVYRQGPAGTWFAAARNDNYLTLESKQHGLRLLAVAENRLLDGQL